MSNDYALEVTEKDPSIHNYITYLFLLNIISKEDNNFLLSETNKL